jgi:oligopeptide transport system ATP-binding protein
MIAMALACNPQILIADEPTTALDVTIQAQIIDLVKRLCDELGMAIIWITHDLGVAAGLADRVLVMYAGQVIEEAETEELFGNPQHPYTIGLLNALPRIDSSEKKRLQSIEGVPPVLYSSPETCPFASRCYRIKGNSPCKTPHLFEVREGHHVACWIDPQTGRIRE